MMYPGYYGDENKTYKIYWDISVTHSTDGYFDKKLVDIHQGYKYTSDYHEATEVLSKINKALELLGIRHISKTGIIEE